MKHKLTLPLVSLLCSAIASCSPSTETTANYTIDDVWTAYDAFNRQYLDTTTYIYKNTSLDTAAIDRWNGAAAIWCQPMYVDMAMNAMTLAENLGDIAREKKYRELSNRILDGNIDHYKKFDFDDNDTNLGWFIYDDIQWWTITLSRAATTLGRDECRQLAEKSFARIWYGSPRVGDTGSYADPTKDLGGGMFWQWQPLDNPNPNRVGDGKMSCINFPTVVAAALLHRLALADRLPDSNPEKWSNSYGDFVRPHFETKERYFEMALEIYDWSIANLAEPDGMINDHRSGDHKSGHPLLYNQGTYIGASTLLYMITGEQRFLDNACAGADYSIKVLSADNGGYLPWAHSRRDPYSQGSLEQGIYPAIWVQYMKLLVDSCGQEQYRPFIEKNIETGWANRNPQNDIADGEAWKSTPTDTLIGSYAASSTPSLMLLFPPQTEK